MKRTAVVFGASGLVGSELIRLLKSSDSYEKITVVVREELDLNHPRFHQEIITDFGNLSDHLRGLIATDYFCCIGTTIKKAGTKEAFRIVDYGIPVKIASLAAQLNIPNVIIVSSIGANTASRNFYLRTKGEMENEVIRIYKGNLKFIRPSLLMGHRKEHRAGEKAAMSFMKLFGWLFTGSLKKYRGIPAHTVARSMIHEASMADGRTFIEGDEIFRSGKEEMI